MRTLLEEEAIGELLGGRISNTLFLPPSRQSWRLQTPGGGVILDRTLHDLDTLMALLGMRVGEVQCLASQRLLGTDVEEEIIGAVKLVGGLTVQLFDSFLLPHVPVMIDFYGSNGQLQATSCDPGNPGAGLHLQRNGYITPVAVPRYDPRGAALEGVVAAVRHGNPAPVGSGDDMRALAAALAMVESARTGGIAQRARP
jgi:1,5-anhydro-D-fructose reductase (1,5-anhydro-D-mannitol-forming)